MFVWRSLWLLARELQVSLHRTLSLRYQENSPPNAEKQSVTKGCAASSKLCSLLPLFYLGLHRWTKVVMTREVGH